MRDGVPQRRDAVVVLLVDVRARLEQARRNFGVARRARRPERATVSTAEKRLSRSVDESSLGAFLTALLEEQAPISGVATREPFWYSNL